MSDELPKGWAECLMGDIAKVVGGGTPDSKDPENFSTTGGISWLTPADLSDHRDIYVSCGQRFLTKKGYKGSSARLMPKGAVLFSSRAPIGYVAVAANEICTNQGFKSFVCEGGVCPEYLYFWLKFAKPLAEELASGTTFAEISGKNAVKVPVHLAPLPEQRRIVAKLETLLAKVDACRQRLEKIPSLLKRFRQSVLAAACSGRLTADWRMDNPEVGDISTPLIKLEQSKNPIFEKMIIPQTWNWLYLSIYIESMSNGIYKPENFYDESGVACLRMYNIQEGRIVWQKLKKMILTSQEVEKFLIRKGDILVNRVNSRELVGKAAILEEMYEPVVFESKNIRLRLKKEKISPDYVNYCFMTRIVRDAFESNAKQTVGMATVSQPQISSLNLPIPPLAEQHEIVRRVEALLKIADRIEERYQRAKTQVDKLIQSILAKAFRGELVPQDPKDEPASVLLERIKHQKKLGDQPKKKKTRDQGKTPNPPLP